jgi:hypothetical protein
MVALQSVFKMLMWWRCSLDFALSDKSYNLSGGSIWSQVKKISKAMFVFHLAVFNEIFT